MRTAESGLVALNGLTTDRRTVVLLAEPPRSNPHELFERVASGSYDKPIMVDDGRHRALCFTIDGCVQSEMSVADPVELVSDYTRKMMAFLLFCPRPRHVLMLGLGGGSLVKFCHRHLPHTRLTAVEVNPSVIALREHFQVPPDDARLRVVEGDGAAVVARMANSGESVDAILVDAYDRRGIARSVSEPAFLEHARRVLGAEGVFVMNLAVHETRRDGYLRMMRCAFGEPVIAVSVNWGGNAVAFAGPALRSRRRLAAAPRYARWIQARLDLSFTKLPGLIQAYLEQGRP